MEINVRDGQNHHENITIFEVVGRVTSDNAAELGAALDGVVNDGRTNLVVDLSGIEYMSSAGLREMVRVLKRVKHSGGDLRLCALSSDAQRVFNLAGLISEKENPLPGKFKVYPSLVEAVGSF